MTFKLLLIGLLTFVLCATMMPMTVAAQPEDIVGQIDISQPITMINDAASFATSTAQQVGVDISQPITIATDTVTQLVGGNGGAGGNGGNAGLFGISGDVAPPVGE